MSGATEEQRESRSLGSPETAEEGGRRDGAGHPRLLSEEKVRLGPIGAEAFQAVTARWPAVLALSLGLALPLELLGAWLQASNPDVPNSAPLPGWDAIQAVIGLVPAYGDLLVLAIAVPVVIGTVVVLVAAELHDRPTDPGAALRTATDRLPALLVVTLALAFGVALTALVAAGLTAVVPDLLPTGSIGDVVAVIPLLVGVALLVVLAGVAYPLAALGRGGIEALRSAVSRLRSDGATLVGRTLAAAAAAAVVAGVVHVLVTSAGSLVGTGWGLQSVSEAVADAVFLPLFGGFAAAIVLELQAREQAGSTPAEEG